MREIGRTWSLGGIKIAVEDDSLDYHKYRFVQHNVLDTQYTDVQRIGSGEIFRNVRGIVFTGYNQLTEFAGSGYHMFVSDQGTEGDYFLSDLQGRRLVAANYEMPIYRITMTLRRDLSVTSGFLLKEDGDYLLLEDGGRLLLEN